MLRIVHTGCGAIEGIAAPEPEITVFRGIPFAAPPVGDLRWRAPQPVDETVLHPVGFIAATAEGSLAAMHSQEPDALDNAIRWVRLLWDTPIRTGTRRYYDNFLYAFAFLALAGEYRVW